MAEYNFLYKITLNGHPDDVEPIVSQIFGGPKKDSVSGWESDSYTVKLQNGVIVKLVIWYNLEPSRPIRDSYRGATSIIRVIGDLDKEENIAQWVGTVRDNGPSSVIKAVIPSQNNDITTLDKICPQCFILDSNDIFGSLLYLAEIIYRLYRVSIKTNEKPYPTPGREMEEAFSGYDYTVKIILFNLPEDIIDQVYKYFQTTRDIGSGPIFRSYMIEYKKVKAQIFFDKYNNKGDHGENPGVAVYGVWYNDLTDDTLDNKVHNKNAPLFILSNSNNVDTYKYQPYYIETNFDPSLTIEYMVRSGYDYVKRENEKKAKQEGQSVASSSVASSTKELVYKEILIYVTILAEQRMVPIIINTNDRIRDLSDLIRIISKRLRVDSIIFTIHYGKLINNKMQPLTAEYTLESGANVSLNQFTDVSVFTLFSVRY